MSYHAPTAEIGLALRRAGGLDRALAAGLYGDLTGDLVDTILEEAGRFAAAVIAPLNRVGDREGASLVDGAVTMPSGWKAAYDAWCAAGWNGVSGPVPFGGQGLPILVNAACTEMWNAAALAFGLGPLLTVGAIEALDTHGSQELKGRYLAKLVSGEWTGTMNLTEPQAGSDLSGMRTRAEPAGDGSYRITGTKIYISYGEHDLTGNIIHLVLARLPEAPQGTRGISLFLIPKILPDGSRNDLRCAGLEGKLGLHGSPTCTMVFGDEGGATGWLVGEPHRGLACMFTMMNNARLNVGLQGVAIAERAYQGALAYARERRQGRAPGADGPSAIVAHPDIKRSLLTMKALTAASRAICYATAAALDAARLAPTAEARDTAASRASLLTPVAKAFSTDNGIEVASLGVQVHGGMGYIEEAGAAQHLRDARILAIYEGTNGIQAIDLATRKLPQAGGAAMRAEIAAMRDVLRRLLAASHPSLAPIVPRLRDGVESLDRATSFMLGAGTAGAAEAVLAAATPYLRLFGIVTGGALLAGGALAAAEAMRAGDNHPAQPGHVALCRFYADHLLTGAGGLERTILTGAAAMADADLALAS